MAQAASGPQVSKTHGTAAAGSPRAGEHAYLANGDSYYTPESEQEEPEAKSPNKNAPKEPLGKQAHRHQEGCASKGAHGAGEAT